ncbi:WD repeat-containing protein 76 isoform X2 [Grus americana]|uniref:WD repeat-containing protein 76 isoform X2 n=1 Tax=Grus americana TaxID=9117 RepID=UPI0024084F67|nr:WD repeat-containing protein 76 isoform X2 [Grus americana]
MGGRGSRVREEGESTPMGTAELQLSPEQGERRAVAARQLRVLLTPLAAAGRRLPQKRLLGAGGGAEGRAPAGKRLCLEPDPPTPASGPATPPAGTAAGSGLDGVWDADSDGSDGGDAAPDGYSQLSAYERKRLKNITENAKFFAALKLHESAARLHQIATKSQSHVTKRAKPKKAEDETVRRRSMRLQRVEPSGMPVLEMPAQPEAEEYPQVPAGPLPMVPEDQMENSKLTEDLLTTWMRISEMKTNATEKRTCDVKRYQDSLNSMVLSEDNVKKVVKYRVCSMAIHPSESIIFVAAGDKSGQIGLWNVNCKSEEGACVFIPHNYPVSCLHFSPFNPAHLLSLSYDTLRCGDVTRAVFDEICRSEENLSSFDFLEDNASTAIVGHWDGDVAVVDRRTPGTSSELSADIGFKRTRTVHVHPMNKQYFIAAGSVDVCIFDVRYLKSNRNKPVSSLKGHTKSVASAYFSPVTGNRVVTVCADDKLRVYDTTSLSSTAAVLSTVRHNNNTGRWLTRFRAVWDPKQEDCFVVGSMARPRQIEVFQDTGKLLHSFYNLDCLGSVCSINVVHPSKNILVGGNSSGRLHVFKE